MSFNPSWFEDRWTKAYPMIGALSCYDMDHLWRTWFCSQDSKLFLHVVNVLSRPRKKPSGEPHTLHLWILGPMDSHMYKTITT